MLLMIEGCCYGWKVGVRQIVAVVSQPVRHDTVARLPAIGYYRRIGRLAPTPSKIAGRNSNRDACSLPYLCTPSGSISCSCSHSEQKGVPTEARSVPSTVLSSLQIGQRQNVVPIVTGMICSFHKLTELVGVTASQIGECPFDPCLVHFLPLFSATGRDFVSLLPPPTFSMFTECHFHTSSCP